MSGLTLTTTSPEATQAFGRSIGEALEVGDVVLLGGAVTMIPAAILGQLAEGGRLVAILLEGEQSLGRGTLMIARNGNFSRREVFDAAVPPLPGFNGEQGFQF